MKTKILVLVLCILATFVLGSLMILNVFGFYSSPDGFSPERFHCVLPGMTVTQVRSLAGQPAKRTEVGAWNERCAEYWDYSTRPWFALTYTRFTVYFDRELKVSRTTVQRDS
jgi:hypothetical protein